MNRKTEPGGLARALLILVKLPNRSVIRFLGLFGEETSRSLAQTAVICDAFAAFSVMGTGRIGTGAFDRIFAGHGFPFAL